MKRLIILAKWILLFIILLTIVPVIVLRSYGINTSEYGDHHESAYRLPVKQKTFCIQSNNTLATHRGDLKYSYDFWATIGTPVYAARSGVVIALKESETAIGFFKGNYIEVLHDDKSIGVYGHLRYNSIIPQMGDTVWQGTLIAATGLTGRSLYPHLHFHVRKAGKTIPVTFNDIQKDKGIPRFLHCY